MKFTIPVDITINATSYEDALERISDDLEDASDGGIVWQYVFSTSRPSSENIEHRCASPGCDIIWYAPKNTTVFCHMHNPEGHK